MQRRTKYLAGILALVIVAAAIAISTALASTPTATGTITGTTPFTFTSEASTENATVTLLEIDGLKLTDKCTKAGNGKPEQQVKATSTVEHADLIAAYNEAGYASAYTSPLRLSAEPQALFSTQETGTDGNQFAGTLTYTTPAGANVTADYQWWTGDEGNGGLNGSQCVFGGVATIAGGS